MAARNSRSTDAMIGRIQPRLEELEKTGQRLCQLQADVVASVKQYFVQSDDMLDVSRTLDHAQMCLDSSVLDLSEWMSKNVPQGITNIQDTEMDAAASEIETEVKDLKDQILVLEDKVDTLSHMLSPNVPDSVVNEMEILKTSEQEVRNCLNQRFRRLAILVGTMVDKYSNVKKEHVETETKLSNLEVTTGQKLTSLERESVTTEQKLRTLETALEALKSSLGKSQNRYSLLQCSTALNMEQGHVNSLDILVFSSNSENQCNASEEACHNKQNHHQFVSQKEFCMDKLPQEYRDKQLAQCINYLAQLSIRIEVNMISTHRPNYAHPNSQRLHSFNGKDEEGREVRLGSGRVSGVFRYDYICNCKECFVSGSPPAQQYGRVWVRTATQLVFDSTEVEHTEAELTLGGVRHSLTGGSWGGVTGRNAVGCDMCMVVFVTHNMELVDRLENLKKKTDQAENELNRKYDRGANQDGLAIMLSHPHGVSSARISLGKTKYWSRTLINGRNCYQLCTTMASCVGCTGARVWPVGLRKPNGEFVNYWHLLHSERTPDGQVTGWIC